MCRAIAPAMVIGVIRPDVVDVRGLIVWGVVALRRGHRVRLGVRRVSSRCSTGPARPTRRPEPSAWSAPCSPSGSTPSMVMLRGIVDQMLFGDRPDPLQAATRVVDRIGDDPVLALRAIREALVLPYASLRVEGQTLATSGTEVTHTRTLPLQLGEDAVGEVVVGLRAGELTLSADDEHVLRIVAPLLAQTLRATALARDLQESRGAAIAAIEDERRRLRRDLHDGLGPTLSGVAFSADAARNHLASDVDAADALAGPAARRHDAGDRRGPSTGRGVAPGDPRRARPRGSRPAARGEPARRRGQGPEGHDRHPRRAARPLGGGRGGGLPDRRGVAHERGSSCRGDQGRTSASRRTTASCTCPSRDDGPSTKQWKPGVGLASMRERAEQVGGSVVASARHDGGRVDAVIPL